MWNKGAFKVALAMTASSTNREGFHRFLCVLTCRCLPFDPAKLRSSDLNPPCSFQSVIACLEEEKAALTLAMADRLRDYQELVQVKTSLSMEVATYR